LRRRANRCAICFRHTHLVCPTAGENHPRLKINFASPFNPITSVQPPREKYSSFVFSETDVHCRCPVLTRGAFRDRHER
jgi:hypothetical protein